VIFIDSPCFSNFAQYLAKKLQGRRAGGLHAQYRKKSTTARSLTDTFAGIRPHDVPAFIAAQLVGAFAAFALARKLFRGTEPAAIEPKSKGPTMQDAQAWPEAV
jgi:hypothetical protein